MDKKHAPEFHQDLFNQKLFRIRGILKKRLNALFVNVPSNLAPSPCSNESKEMIKSDGHFSQTSSKVKGVTSAQYEKAVLISRLQMIRINERGKVVISLLLVVYTPRFVFSELSILVVFLKFVSEMSSVPASH